MNPAGVYNALLDWLWPPACRLCGLRLTGWPELCPGCHADLPWLLYCCSRCARPLPRHGHGTTCGRCLQQAPPYDRTLALFTWQPPADYLLKRLKFNGDLGMAPLLATLFARRVLQQDESRPEMLVPVPLHPSRLRERGFNQATELARPLARQLQLPLQTGLCRRVRHTEAQSLLPPAARRLNMRRAFTVTDVPVNAHIAIVDDVMTTGHTARELAGELKRAGAARVDVWVMARAGT